MPDDKSLADDPVVRALAEPLLGVQQEPVVFAARCCNRVGVSVQGPIAKCGVCGKPPVETGELRAPSNVS